MLVIFFYFFLFLITYGLWHNATEKVNGTSGLVMPSAYCSSIWDSNSLPNMAAYL